MNKKIAVVAALVLIAIGVGTWWFYGRPAPAADHLTLYGNIDIRQVSLAFENSDRVREMRVEEGDHVQAGQVLATLDTRSLALQADQAKAQVGAQEQALLRLRNGSRPEEVEQLQAQVRAAEAEARQAQLRYKRLKDIATRSGGQAISKQEVDDTQASAEVAQAQLENQRKALKLAQIGPRAEDIAQAQAQLEAAKASLALLEHQLTLSVLKSPTNAVVRARLLEPGDMASPAKPAYTLALTSPKWVRAYVNEVQLGHVRPDMAAEIVTDSHPDQPIAGRVGYISPVAEFTPKNVQTEELRTSLVYEVRILVDDPQDRLRLGMPATVTIALDKAVSDGNNSPESGAGK
ncbi:efflux RND transporter periplasmic adaptor subunit [Advenella mimigardefordensis]|uniref:Putative secretion protein, HlyD family n=1 Tax=Advenella mimigardefordensis (strain DSM 17166 / LMG 22922 / DPN7) TaxID=1247726 RepID=W0PGD6_ADVMD|nr:efflux RND transporter periplasmic adaptor subunit [Advenella mimigardefordensis]AHG66149.1 putative secretion protein, HlyD family [Advenella mimigardefordensis DPN7]